MRFFLPVAKFPGKKLLAVKHEEEITLSARGVDLSVLIISFRDFFSHFSSFAKC